MQYAYYWVSYSTAVHSALCAPSDVLTATRSGVCWADAAFTRSLFLRAALRAAAVPPSRALSEEVFWVITEALVCSTVRSVSFDKVSLGSDGWGLESSHCFPEDGSEVLTELLLACNREKYSLFYITIFLGL